MKLTRRAVIASSLAASIPATILAKDRSVAAQAPPRERFDPWIEVVPEALQFNLGQLRMLAGERPVLAVVKNNAYGLGLIATARLLEKADAVIGFYI